MTILEVTLNELPPSLNHLYATVEIDGKSRRVLSSAANDWKRSAAWEIKAAAMQQGWTCEKKIPLFVEVFYQSPSVLRWDLDGKPKLVLDALCDAFGLDDRYVMRLDQSKARSGLEQMRLRVMKGEVEL